MTHDDRFRLLFGPYKKPRFHYGDTVMCDFRGEVTICGLTDARIPWPIGKRRSAKTLVIFGDLSRALRGESAQAVAYWWGVDVQTITKWRKALDVAPTTEGTKRLRHDYALEPKSTRARKKAHAQSRDPILDQERRTKIRLAKLGKPRPLHVVQAVIAAHLGKTPSDEARRSMSLAQRRRGTRPPKAGRPWTEEEDRLVKMLAGTEAAARTGRTLTAVYARRIKLELPDGRCAVR